jgi:S-DNA-T family DNA segregation ATPase FtsK/SpoIIIE
MAKPRVQKPTLKAPKHNMRPIWGLFTLCGSVLMMLSLLSFSYGHQAQNWIGIMGFTIGKIFHASFGILSYLICAYIGWIGWRKLFNKTINHPWLKAFYLFVFIASFAMLLSVIEDFLPTLHSLLSALFYPNMLQKKLRFHLGGAPLYYIYKDLPGINLLHILNATGVIIIFSTTLAASALFLFKLTPNQIARALINFFSGPKTEPQEQEMEEEIEEPIDSTRLVKVQIPANPNRKEVTASNDQQEMLEIQPETNLTVRPSISQKGLLDKKRPSLNLNVPLEKPAAPVDEKQPVGTPAERKRKAAIEAQKVYNGDFKSYKIPSPNLLTVAKKVDHSSLKQDLKRQAEVLEETLQSFGIEAKVGQINCGPTITSFEVHPSIGVKVQKIKALENDIALNMEAKSIRIIAPIPGKAAVGIEVPNSQPQEVGFKEMLTAYQQSNKKFHIPILLGKAVNGEYVMSDLTKMPHCIIAGATGSGKSVCINTIVMSVVLNLRPDEIKLVLVDPKKVELTPYMKLPHMLAPVITEPQGACAALNWLVKEMEKRYEILKQLGVRNIDAFNKRTINKDFEASLELEIPNQMHYILVIIDELADLMMVSSNDIETPIARIAQMARAVGIHLILATQRPSREVITGIIKANFPTRIAFKVASRVNSQIILDEVGAESLLGNGDMLFLPPGSSILTRAQGAYIRDEDIAAVVKAVTDQAPPNYVISSFDEIAKELAETNAASESNGDSLYDQAVDIVVSAGNASTTFLQRKLKIGYARSASLIDELEHRGVISAAEGGKSRKVLLSRGGEKLETANASNSSDDEGDLHD